VRGVVGVADGLADAATGGDLVAVRVRPLADLRELFRVPTLRRAAGAGATGAARDLAGGGDIVGVSTTTVQKWKREFVGEASRA